jgi:hypothetical protein
MRPLPQVGHRPAAACRFAQARLAAALTARLGFPFAFDWKRQPRLKWTPGGKFEDLMSLVPADA